MKKFLKLFVILVISLIVTVACNNRDTSTEDSGDSTNESIEETDQEENRGGVDEDSNVGNRKNEDLPEAQEDEEVTVLELGETGVIEDTLGIYEVTATSVRFTDSLGEGNEKEITRNDTLVVIEVDLKNIGSETLALEDITKTNLFREDGSSVSGFSDYPEIIQFQGEIDPDENFIGHLVFDTREQDYYELAFGAYMPSHISNEVRWAIHAEDAE